MVWSRTVLDGIVMCVIFNVTVALVFLLTPHSFSKMLPAEIVGLLVILFFDRERGREND